MVEERKRDDMEEINCQMVTVLQIMTKIDLFTKHFLFLKTTVLSPK
jgi:hypothetical protein